MVGIALITYMSARMDTAAAACHFNNIICVILSVELACVIENIRPKFGYESRRSEANEWIWWQTFLATSRQQMPHLFHHIRCWQYDHLAEQQMIFSPFVRPNRHRCFWDDHASLLFSLTLHLMAREFTMIPHIRTRTERILFVQIVAKHMPLHSIFLLRDLEGLEKFAILGNSFGYHENCFQSSGVKQCSHCDGRRCAHVSPSYRAIAAAIQNSNIPIHIIYFIPFHSFYK